MEHQAQHNYDENDSVLTSLLDELQAAQTALDAFDSELERSLAETNVEIRSENKALKEEEQTVIGYLTRVNARESDTLPDLIAAIRTAENSAIDACAQIGVAFQQADLVL